MNHSKDPAARFSTTPLRKIFLAEEIFRTYLSRVVQMSTRGVFESMAEPAISVCVSIVTYNSRRFIGACLDTLLRQDAPPFEIVVVDNASTDGTRDVLASFGGRIHAIFNDSNIGFAAAQNQGI